MRPTIVVLALSGAIACGPPMPPDYPSQRASEPARPAAAVEGEVLGVDRVAPADSLASGVQLRVTPGASETVVVDLAPDWYLDQRGLSFRPADRVRVEGSRVQKRGRVVIYATRVEKGERVVQLREPETGRPLWLR